MEIENNTKLLSGLKAFGLDKKEATIYLAGLHIGSATVIELSHHAKLPRTTVYSILEKLVQENLFQVGKRKKRTVYTAESPQNLEKMFQKKQLTFHEITHDLVEIHNINFKKANAVILEGTEGFKKMWQEVFNSGVKEYRIISSGKGMLEYVREPYLVRNIISERVKLGIKSRQLIAECRDSKPIVERDKKELRESRLLPYGSEIPAAVIIFGNKIAFITTRHENVIISVMSGDAAITYATVFDLLWSVSKNPYNN